MENIEIFLCYSSTMSINEMSITNLSINKIQTINYFISFSKKKYYFYHFNIVHTNNDDIIKQKIRKWKFIFNFLFDFQMFQKSINHIANRFFILTLINESNILFIIFDFHQMRINFYFKSVIINFTSLFFISTIKLISNKKHVDLKTLNKSLKNRDLTFLITTTSINNRICRRCKQHFILKNLLHKHILHCNKNIIEFKFTIKTVKLNKS